MDRNLSYKNQNTEKVKKEKADINELFILDIMREGIKNGDARLF